MRSLRINYRHIAYAMGKHLETQGQAKEQIAIIIANNPLLCLASPTAT